LEPYFSLITSTIGREIELERLLKSLQSQTWLNFEFILIDQSQNLKIQALANHYESIIPLHYIDARGQRGLSLGRNLGLQQAKGNLIAIPDDDCWYAPNVLETVVQWFTDHPDYDGLCGRSRDLEGKLTSCRWDSTAGEIRKYNIWRRAISPTIFLRSRITQNIGLFDTQLGLGTNTPWQCGEETDYLLRALDQGFKLYYSTALEIYHLEPTVTYSNQLMKRAQGYGSGYGYILRKHHYSLPFMAQQVIRPLVGSLLKILQGDWHKANYNWTVALRRLQGMLSYDENSHS
jgi:glycosyltransferase involved in cell wall biosynthesis